MNQIRKIKLAHDGSYRNAPQNYKTNVRQIGLKISKAEKMCQPLYSLVSDIMYDYGEVVNGPYNEKELGRIEKLILNLKENLSNIVQEIDVQL